MATVFDVLLLWGVDEGVAVALAAAVDVGAAVDDCVVDDADDEELELGL